MSGDMVRDRVLLALLLTVGTSSALWGLYMVYYVSPTSPSGLFNTFLGLLVLLVTWAFLVPSPLPRKAAKPNTSELAPTRSAATSRARAAATGRPAPAPLYRGSRSRPTAMPLMPSTVGLPRLVASATVSASGRPALASAAMPRRAPSPPTMQEEKEIAEILADLPEPLDPALAAESADDVVRRLDALLRDLSVEPAGPRTA
jgi:hypothetical protein